jgi:hypothetical protein
LSGHLLLFQVIGRIYKVIELRTGAISDRVS